MRVCSEMGTKWPSSLKQHYRCEKTSDRASLSLAVTPFPDSLHCGQRDQSNSGYQPDHSPPVENVFIDRLHPNQSDAKDCCQAELTVGDLGKCKAPRLVAGQRSALGSAAFQLARRSAPCPKVEAQERDQYGSETSPDCRIFQLTVGVRDEPGKQDNRADRRRRDCLSGNCNRIIEAKCGLRPSPQNIAFWGCLALLLVLSLPSVALGIGLYRLAPIQLPGEVETFGDLVEIVSSRSIGALAGQGARLGPNEAWRALTDVLSAHTQLSRGQIGPETLLFSSRPATTAGASNTAPDSAWDAPIKIASRWRCLQSGYALPTPAPA